MPKVLRRHRCPVCDCLFSQTATTGRPKRYCGDPCKRVAGYEIQRINRHLERLETERDRLSERLDDPVPYSNGSTVRYRYDHHCKLITDYKTRLLTIGDDREEGN